MALQIFDESYVDLNLYLEESVPPTESRATFRVKFYAKIFDGTISNPKSSFQEEKEKIVNTDKGSSTQYIDHLRLMNIDDLLAWTAEKDSFPGDKLTISLELLINDKKWTAGGKSRAGGASREFFNDNAKYGPLSNPSNSDVQIKCGDETIYAHKVILSAQSPVFDRMFKTDMKENTNGILEIVDVELEILKLALEFLYSGKIQEMPTETIKIISLLTYADKYDLKGLKSLCIKYMSLSLCLENAGPYTVALARFSEEEHLPLLQLFRNFCALKHLELIKNQEYRQEYIDNAAAFLDP